MAGECSVLLPVPPGSLTPAREERADEVLCFVRLDRDRRECSGYTQRDVIALGTRRDSAPVRRVRIVHEDR